MRDSDAFSARLLRTARRSPLPAEYARKSESDRAQHLVHGARRLGAAGFADDPGGNPRDRHIVRHRFHHHRTRGDAGAIADLDIAQNLRARPDQYAAADLGMAVLVLLAGAAERD